MGRTEGTPGRNSTTFQTAAPTMQGGTGLRSGGIWGGLTGPSIRLCVSRTMAACEGEPETTKKECPLGLPEVGPLGVPEVGQVLEVGPHHKRLGGTLQPISLVLQGRNQSEQLKEESSGSGDHRWRQPRGDHHANSYLRSIHLYHELTVGVWA